ncbi:MAG: hypothetical protein IPP74_11385 [Alphaproteobacteria bacterium]|nr:hypothetical protein [Alphaproteobacteria bacterium]
MNLNQPFKLSQDGTNYIKLLKEPNSGDEKSLADYEKQPIESTAYQVQGSVKAAVNAWLDPLTCSPKIGPQKSRVC